jgi:O-acetyl-ADP-ribose deacetylase (regulator of RNase III)
MTQYLTGDIFSSPAQVITNAVNCVGVMGAGLALEFKKRFPRLNADYEARCKRGDVSPGRPYLYEDDDIQVLNFPTKRHWQDNSRLEDIEEGLKYLAAHHAHMGIFFLALPPLGCGLGGLNWTEVKSLIEKHLGGLADLEVLVYEPSAAKSKSPRDGDERSQSHSRSNIAAQPDA